FGGCRGLAGACLGDGVAHLEAAARLGKAVADDGARTAYGALCDEDTLARAAQSLVIVSLPLLRTNRRWVGHRARPAEAAGRKTLAFAANREAVANLRPVRFRHAEMQLAIVTNQRPNAAARERAIEAARDRRVRQARFRGRAGGAAETLAAHRQADDLG